MAFCAEKECIYILTQTDTHTQAVWHSEHACEFGSTFQQRPASCKTFLLPFPLFPFHDLCRINRQKDQVLHAPPGSSLSPSPSLVPCPAKLQKNPGKRECYWTSGIYYSAKWKIAECFAARKARPRPRPTAAKRARARNEPRPSQPASPGRATLGIRIRIRVRYAFCGKLSNQQRLPNDNWNLETLRRYTFIASSFFLCLLRENAISVRTISAMSWQVQLKK